MKKIKKVEDERQKDLRKSNLIMYEKTKSEKNNDEIFIQI